MRRGLALSNSLNPVHEIAPETPPRRVELVEASAHTVPGMPIDYQRDDRTRWIRITATEPVTSEDLIEIANRQAAEGAWSYALLYDGSARHEPPSPDTIHRLVLQAGVLTTKHGRRGPIALVLRAPELGRMAKRYATLGELAALNARVFTTLQEAEDWLRQES